MGITFTAKGMTYITPTPTDAQCTHIHSLIRLEHTYTHTNM